jgi:FtsP/CotA-like multicopper oxidase with cupredoxin domain
MMVRREFIALSAVAALCILTGCGSSTSGGMGGMMGAGAESSSGNQVAKKGTLPIPELLQPRVKEGVNHYDLTLQKSKHTFFEGVESDTFAINSSYLGPTLLLKDKTEVSLNFTNRLDEATTMHSHGMHVPSIMDGTPHQVIAPNQTWSARYRVNQKASTNWYHPHFMGKTAEHVYKGLAGLIIVEDAESEALDLPNRYGVDDIPLVLQDRVFTDGQINYSPSMRQVMHGYIGDTFITNGAIEPTFNAEAKELRLRLLNGSNSSVYELGFVDGRSFKQIATDNAFLEAPVTLRKLTLSPAERAEIVVDLSGDKGKSLVLKEFRQAKSFLTIDVTKDATAQTSLPTSLTALNKLDPAQAVRRRSFTLSGRMGSFQINGKSMDINRIDEEVPLGDIEIWEVKNSMMMDHNFHIHATHFMLIERDGSVANVAENEKGYKDVVYIPSGGSVKFIVQMVDYKDTKVPYMYHCHFLEHEDAGMMGQFLVV